MCDFLRENGTLPPRGDRVFCGAGSGVHKTAYQTQHVSLAHFSTGHLLSGTGESEALEAKV